MAGRILKDLEAQRLISLSGKTIMISSANQRKLLAMPVFQALFSQKNS
jgi:tRNA A37 threonylcarbamoyladenosine synthetase subunit TsaC/SUA5/YrdC